MTMVGRGLGHLAPDVKRARVDAEEAADGAAGGRGEAGGGRDCGAPRRATTDQPAFHVGVGVDDVAAETRGPGTQHLTEHLLWELRNDEFERQALLGTKSPCPKCGAKKKYFCEKCTAVVGGQSLIPAVRLPLEIAVIRDERENKAKSTATHAALVSPDVTIFTYPELPSAMGDDAASAEESVLLFPSATSVEVEALDWRKVKRVLLIDSTWITCNQMLRDTRLKRLRHMRIRDEQTTFWRYHHHGETCLSTIECIYHTLRQYQLATAGEYRGQFDSILFYYAHLYRQIQLHYLRRPHRLFMHKSNYIHYQKAAREAQRLSLLGVGTGNVDDEGEEDDGFEVQERATEIQEKVNSTHHKALQVS